MNSHQQITFSELATGLVRTLPEMSIIAQGVLGMVSSGPDSKMSIGRLLEQQASRYPNKPAIKFENQFWTYSSFNKWVNQLAALFTLQEIKSGDVIGIMSENRPEVLACVAAAAKVGAIAGMLNFNQRHDALNYSIDLIKPKLLVVGSECVDALEETDYGSGKMPDLMRYIIGEAESIPSSGYQLLEQESKGLPSVNPRSTKLIRLKQPCFYIFTSGTTGMPKASIMSHLRWFKGAMGMGLLTTRLQPDDVVYAPLPLYHNNALTVSWGSSMVVGACFALSRRFSASQFWNDVRKHKATAFCYIGELCRYLLNRERSPMDRQHRIRLIFGNGLRPEIWMEFKHRFNIPRICEFYGASECNIAFVNGFNLDCTAGYTPFPFAVVECDPETEQPQRDFRNRFIKVKQGNVGLLVTKINRLAPFDGYTDASASEKKIFHDAFKKGDSWFNTGDLVRDQGYHHIQFVDRLGDTFRWKGENVATTEVEAAFKPIEQIEQAVVYGVQVPESDGRAGMATVTLTCTKDKFDLEVLANNLLDNLPRYAVPLFLRIKEEVMITGTFKNRKVELKEEGFDISRIQDPIFILKPSAKNYVKLNNEIVGQLKLGKLPD